MFSSASRIQPAALRCTNTSILSSPALLDFPRLCTRVALPINLTLTRSPFSTLTLTLHKFSVRMCLPASAPAYDPSKPTIVFIHGLLVDSEVWTKTMAPLAAQGYQCIAPDLPLGCQLTPVKDRSLLTFENVAKGVEEMLAGLGVKEYVIVGNDTGGVIVQTMIRREIEGNGRGRKIKGLVMTPCDCFDNFLPAIFMPLIKLARTLPGTLLIDILCVYFTNPYLVNMPLSLCWLVKKIPDQTSILEALTKRIVTTDEVKKDVKKILLDVDNRHTLRLADELHKFRRPSTVVVTPDDTMLFSAKYMMRFAEVLRRSPSASAVGTAMAPYDKVKTVEVADSYAFVMLDQPERLAEVIAQHMEENATL
ncbi:Alpha/Beta hydrolase protein [Zopfochytrium polystomum]|nr:Alpha/Beta hydrolase protein [Zopfochytrium polystomum]